MTLKDSSSWVQSRVHILENTFYPPSSGTFVGSTKRIVRTRDGTRNPGYKKQIAAKQNATTSLTGVWTSVTSSPTYVKIEERNISDNSLWGRFEYEGYDIEYLNFGADILPPGWSFSSSSADSRAATGFLSQVRKQMVAMSGPTFLGEFRDTARMLRRPAEGLSNLVNNYVENLKRQKRKGGRKGMDWKKNLGQAWLENAFGWQPLMHDIDDAFGALNSLLDKTDRVVRISSGGKDEMKTGLSTHYDYIVPQAGSYNAVLFTDRVRRHHVVRYRGAVYARAATTARDRFARFGFTPSEFVPTAWEVLPWSFLADYFANIGDMLSASVTDTSNVAWVSKSDIRTTELTMTSTFGSATTFPPTLKKSINIVRPGNMVLTHKSVTRSANVGVPTPSLYFTYPGSNGRLANIAALLASVNTGVHPQSPSPRNYRR